MNKYSWKGYKSESPPKNEEVKKEEKVENSPPVKQNDGGKGSIPRPFDKNTYRKNWDNVFKKIYG
tara:strand:- start:359 stop:553 length:195 start_codon:yes stop_codon:yes gene_type:complete